MTNHLDFLLDNYQKEIYLKILNNSIEEIRLTDININKEDISLKDIDKKRSVIPCQTFYNILQIELFLIFREEIFRKSKFLTGISILDIRYKYPGTQNNNLFYPFNNQLNYGLAQYFVKSKKIKCNVNKFFTNIFIKYITKRPLYYNANKQLKEQCAILQGIPNNK